MNARDTLAAITAATEARDTDALVALYADDVVFHSPVTPLPFRGREEAGALLAVVVAAFEEWVPTFAIAQDDQAVLGVAARIGGRSVELTEHFTIGADGRVTEARLCGRPLAGVAAIAAQAAPALAARHGRLRRAATGALIRPLPPVLATGDRAVNRLAR